MKTKAITLTETILVILIIGTIMACLAPYLKGIQDFWIFTDRQTAILQGARDAMNKMIKTLKAAHSITDIDPSGRGTYLALTNYLDQPIVYFHNIESSPYYIGNTGNIKIGDLVMQTKDPSNNTVNSLLCQSVDSITFTYIKPSMDRSDPATSPDQVQAVRILFYAKDPDQTTDIRLPISCLAYLMNVKASRTNGPGLWIAYTDIFSPPSPSLSIAYLIKVDLYGNILLKKEFSDSLINSISVDPTDGSLWFADWWKNKVVKLNAEGQELFEIPNCFLPRGISVNTTDGSCWFFTEHSGQKYLVKVDSQGNELRKITISERLYSGKTNSTDGSYWCRAQLPTSTIFNGKPCSDWRILKFDSNGIKEVTYGQNLSSYGAPSINTTDGSCWFREIPSPGSNSQLTKINANGIELFKTGDTGFFVTTPSVDSNDGSVWTLDEGTRKLIKYDQNGNKILTVTAPYYPRGVIVNQADSSFWLVVRGYDTNPTGVVWKAIKYDNEGRQILEQDTHYTHMGTAVFDLDYGNR